MFETHPYREIAYAWSKFYNGHVVGCVSRNRKDTFYVTNRLSLLLEETLLLSGLFNILLSSEKLSQR